jgi:2-dehydropantoate 2-reductase
MDTQSFREHVAIAHRLEPAASGRALVLCCVKSTDTAQAAAEMAPHLAPDAIVLSLQNGYDNAERLQAAWGAGASRRGLCRHRDGGPGPPAPPRPRRTGDRAVCRSAEVVAEFAVAGVPVQVSDNVAGALWAKLIINCAYNALSAITQLPYGRMRRAKALPA